MPMRFSRCAILVAALGASANALAQSDDEILDMVRAYGSAGLHAVGTCRMGSDLLAVLDERLRVRGVAGLRVVRILEAAEQSLAAGGSAVELR